VNPATNQITTAGYSYDASGNMLKDAINTLTYDAENRALTSTGSLGSATYTYDGNGLRVEKSGSNGSTIYIFSGAKVIAEYAPGAQASSPTTEYIYGGANLVASITSGTTTYYHPDQLSVRALTSSTGSVVGQQGTYPFGESWYAVNTTTKWFFTSYERDPESANDYAMARYYVNRLGRFNSPDPIPGSIADPQSWNRYTYVRNDPVNSTDPLGLCDYNDAGQFVGGHDGETCCTDSGVCLVWDSGSSTWSPDPSPPGDGSGDDTGGDPGAPSDPSAPAGDNGGGILQKAKNAVCSAIPSGSVVSAGGTAGTLGGLTGSFNIVTNYNSGQISAFASGGPNAGFNGGGSVNASYGQIYGYLSSDNSNFSGPFTTLSGSVGVFGGSLARSSGGLSAPLATSGPTIVSVSAGRSLFGPVTFGMSVTTSTQPLQIGNLKNGTAPIPSVADYLFYLLRRGC
jgi:RHS repeat-associated protein